MDAADCTYRAERALNGVDPEHTWPISDGGERATPYLLLALVREQQHLASRLVDLNTSLTRIATALEQQPEPAPEVEPKRRPWLSVRRRKEA